MKKARGAALIVTIWLVAMAAIVGLNFSLASRAEVKESGLIVARQQTRAAAEAGVWRFVYELTREGAAEIWRPDGTPIRFQFDDIQVTAAAQDLSGLVDLNFATPDTILWLLRYLIHDPDRANEISDVILDWRDADHATRPFGAEDSEPGGTQTGYAAKDGPFNSVEELQRIDGLSMEEYRLIRPFVTVHGESALVNDAVAPKRIQSAIRQNGGVPASRSGAPRLGPAESNALLKLLAVDRGDVTYDIFAEAGQKGVLSRIAATITVRRSRSGDQPVAVLAWRESWPWRVEFDWNDDAQFAE